MRTRDEYEDREPLAMDRAVPASRLGRAFSGNREAHLAGLVSTLIRYYLDFGLSEDKALESALADFAADYPAEIGNLRASL